MKKFLILFSILTIITSCDLPEHYFSAKPACTSNQNSLESDVVLSQENQKTLRDKIRNKQPKDYRYFFETFLEEKNKTYMITNVRNAESCFNLKILVDKWDKLSGMRRTNGVSYPKELYDLKWEIKTVENQEEIVFVDMHKIID